MSNEIKEKEKYEKYARDHRKELDAQEVRLGDVVTVLVGHFAGEKGVIVGMIACDKSDYADPYYEIEMECDVPEEFRVRKTLIGQSRVIGGVEKRYLKVIGNRAPKQPSMEIKQGDKVRVSKDAPRIYTDGWRFDWRNLESIVSIIENDDAVISPDDSGEEELTIPTKYLFKVDAEAKEAKYHKGDKVRHIKNDECGIVLNVEADGVYVGVAYSLQKRFWKNREIEPVQPTEQTYAEKKPYDGISEETANEISDMLEAYAKALSGIADPFDLQRYEADLAKEVALKVANKLNDPEQAAEYAVSVAKAVVEGLKRK